MVYKPPANEKNDPSGPSGKKKLVNSILDLWKIPPKTKDGEPEPKSPPKPKPWKPF